MVKIVAVSGLAVIAAGLKIPPPNCPANESRDNYCMSFCDPETGGSQKLCMGLRGGYGPSGAPDCQCNDGFARLDKYDNSSPCVHESQCPGKTCPNPLHERSYEWQECYDGELIIADAPMLLGGKPPCACKGGYALSGTVDPVCIRTTECTVKCTGVDSYDSESFATKKMFKDRTNFKTIWRSGDGLEHVEWTNNLKKPVTIFWQDYSGKGKAYGVIAPGNSYKGQTYPYHKWYAEVDGVVVAAWNVRKPVFKMTISQEKVNYFEQNYC